MMTKIVINEIDINFTKANGFDTINIYSNGNLIKTISTSKVDSSGKLEVLVDGEVDGEGLSFVYDTVNGEGLSFEHDSLHTEPFYSNYDITKYESVPETLSGSLDDIRKSLTGDRKSIKTPIP